MSACLISSAWLMGIYDRQALDNVSKPRVA